jgi:hypothetical protein
MCRLRLLMCCTKRMKMNLKLYLFFSDNGANFFNNYEKIYFFYFRVFCTA